MLDTETGAASSTGFTYAAQYGVRRASTRPDVYRTQFGSISADEFLTPMLPSHSRNDGNIARRLSRNSFLIPPQTFVRHVTDGMLIKCLCRSSRVTSSFGRVRMRFGVFRRVSRCELDLAFVGNRFCLDRADFTDERSAHDMNPIRRTKQCLPLFQCALKSDLLSF